MEPILLYHSARTGENDETLKSFQNLGIIKKEGYIESSHQKNGFFVEPNRTNAELHAREGYLDDNDRPPPGKPLLVTVRYDSRPGWELDYEDMSKEAKELLFNYMDELSRIPSGILKLQEGYIIDKVTPIYDDKRDGLEISLLHEASSQKETAFMSWDKAMRGTGEKIAEPGLLQVFRDYLVTALGDQYLGAERGYIGKIIERKPKNEFDENVISLKYSGDSPPPIVNLETFDGKKWVQEPLHPDTPSHPLPPQG